MSGYVNKLFTTISSALEFNTATLSGAIDIVVIEDDEGRRHCSPFHVRFGKLQLLKSRGIPVQIHLNGHRTSLSMLLGAAGEAYFYNPHHVSSHSDPLPAESFPADSLPTNPVSTPSVSTAAMQPPALELDPADLIIRANSQPIPASSSESAPTSPLYSYHRHESHPSISIRHDPLAAALQSRVVETKDSDYPFGYISDSEVELTRIEREGTAEVVDEPRSPSLFAPQRKWSSTVAQNPPASHAADRKEEAILMLSLQRNGQESPPLSKQNSPLLCLRSSQSAVSMPASGAGTEAVEEKRSAESPRLTEKSTVVEQPAGGSIITSKARSEAGALTVSNTISDVVGEEDGKLDCRSIDGYDADEDNADDLQDLQEQVAYVLSKPQNIAIRERGEDADAGGHDSVRRGAGSDASRDRPDAYTSSRHGVLDMSLCGGLLRPEMEELQIVELFDRHKVSYTEFSTNPTLLYDPGLLFRVDNRLVELRVAVPFIFSVLAFNERLNIDTLDRVTATEHKVEEPKSPPTPSRRFGWFGWASPAVAGEPVLQEEDLAVLDDQNARIAKDIESEQQENATAATKKSKGSTENEEVGKDGMYEKAGTEAILDGSTKEPISDDWGPDAKEEQGSAQESRKVDSTVDGVAGGSVDSVISPMEAVAVAIPFSELDPEALSLRPTVEELKSLPLEPGANTIRFVVESSAVELNCRIFLWSCHSKIVISDVDGTITRSDVLGHLLPAVGRDWSQVGVAGLYTQIEKNGYKVLYLTARPIGQASQTRTFLKNVTQGRAKLPNGPVLMSPNRLVESFTREVIRRKPHEFKIAALREVRSLFSPDYNPFHAGFGNRDTDVISYRAVGLIPQRIFVVNPKGELVVMKAKYESAASYSTLQDLVESVFPDISGHGGLEKIQALTESARYNDWNYWKGSLPRIDLDDLLEQK